jgi:hypothetical protein
MNSLERIPERASPRLFSEKSSGELKTDESQLHSKVELSLNQAALFFDIYMEGIQGEV